MKIGRLIAPLLLLASLQTSRAQSFQNQITLPSKQYMLTSTANEMYVQTFLKRSSLGDVVVRFGGSTHYAQAGRLEKKAVIDKPSTGETIEIEMISLLDFSTISSISSQVVAGEASKGEREVKVQFLGDSFTKGIYFKDAFLDSGYVPNVKLIGTREIPDNPGQFHEGRGGWTLKKYFSDLATEALFYNPYYQPSGEYRYWGSSAFWQTVIALKQNPKADFSIRYNCDGYDSSGFGEDGKRVSPVKGDLIFNSQTREYEAWNGKKWKTVERPAAWSFDFAKYLEMWQLEAPEFLVVMLGLNDFRDLDMPLDFTEWNSMAEELLKSYKSAVPDGRLALCTPCTSCGTLDNERGDFTTKQNAAMWEVRKNIIDTFDCREDEGIHVVDASITIDNENGYNTKGGVQTGNPHPYPSYPALGVPIAAFVQYYRDK
ncbi:MAG: hypothetical protein R3Y55_00930 [Rikenellaceae bacterium]